MQRVLLLWILVILPICGCTRGEESVLVVLKTLDNPFFIDIQKGFDTEWKKLGMHISVTIKAGQKEGDVSGQRGILDAQYNQFVAGKKFPLIRGVLLTPSSSGSDLVQQVRNFRRSNISVVLLDTPIQRDELVKANTDYNLLVTSDNRKGGKLAAETLAEGLKNKQRPCEILLLNGVADHDPARDRRAGFLEEMQARGCTVALEKTANWRRTEAQEIVGQLATQWKYSGIFAANDEMALGATAALRQAGTGADTLVVGFDATDEGRQAVKEGRLYATIAQDPVEMGRRGARALADYLRNTPPSFSVEFFAPTVVRD